MLLGSAREPYTGSSERYKMKIKRPQNYLLFALIILSGSVSCWYYSFTGKSLPGVESVYIPVFTDRSVEFQLKDMIQQQLIKTFQEENIFKIESADNADAILNGVILPVQDRPATVNKDERTEMTEVYIAVEFKLEDRKTGKVIIQEKVNGVGFYETTLERDNAIAEALIKLTQEIANKILTNW